MIIDQLPLMSGNPQDDDEFPIERGTTTYKTKLQALAAGIFGKIASSATPLMDGAASPGTDTSAARADHRHPTDTTRAAAAELATYVRPNLLDNWYFVGGGSQLGYGTFPINQRGQTTYSGNGVAIDRWPGDGSTKELSADGIKSTRTGSNTWIFYQSVGAYLAGKTVTLSALVLAYSGTVRMQITWFEGSAQKQLYNQITATGIVSVTATLPANAVNVHAIVWAGEVGAYAKLSAIKLEIGSTQTLAHQKNGAWVLNEIPNYSEELTKCRRYYRRYVSAGVYDYCLNGCLTSGKAHLLVGLPDGTQMVKRSPTATISGSVVVRGVNGYIANPSAEPLVIANNGYSEGYGTTLPIQKSTGAVWTDEDINNSLIQVGLTAGTIIEISAE